MINSTVSKPFPVFFGEKMYVYTIPAIYIIKLVEKAYKRNAFILNAFFPYSTAAYLFNIR